VNERYLLVRKADGEETDLGTSLHWSDFGNFGEAISCGFAIGMAYEKSEIDLSGTSLFTRVETLELW
jgi:hypothetical protein